MAIAPTGAIYKSLSFDGEDSRNYGVYITGEAVYNAPERDVEMITIPGRNGSFALDNGRFQNIEVSYPAGIFADTEVDFRQAISDFRNFLCSRKGYVRLQDEYNPDEYRMAVYKSGLEVDPAMLKAGEFTITFDCKPQRWLVSGETEVAVESGDTLTNPTLFESSPLLEVEGGGTISFNGYNIELENGPYGDIQIIEQERDFPRRYQSYIFNSSIANIGDQIKIDLLSVDTIIPSGHSVTFVREDITGSGFNYSYSIGADGLSTHTEMTDVVLTVGTASTLSYRLVVSQPPDNYLRAGSITVEYDGNDTITIYVGEGLSYKTSFTNYHSACILTSTKLILEGTIYIDCDLGEAYKIEDGQIVSLNAYIDLGSDLPTLAPGTNTVTYDNTITELNITPRWWKI